MTVKRGTFGALGAAAAVAAATALVAGPAAMPAAATTGNSDGLPEPKVLVNEAIGDLYIGRFYLTRIERRAGISSAGLDVDYTESVEHPFLVGDGEFYQYNSAGALTSWTASLYPYVYRHGLLSCKLLVPGTVNHVLGRLVLDRPKNLDTAAHPNDETINGHLTVGHSTYAVTFGQAEDDNPTPQHLPRAVQVGLPAAQAAEAPEAARESETSVLTGDSGVYASVVALAQDLG